MRRAVLSSLWAHKARLTLTALAVVLGVAFVVGTLVFSDTLRATFEDTFIATTEGVDVQIQVAEEFGGTGFSIDQRGGVPPVTLERIASIEGVRAVEGEVSGYAQFVIEGEPVGGQGPPTLGVNAPADESLREEELREGRFPAEAGEVAIDAATARDHDLVVGDMVEIMTGGPPEPHEITGIVGYGDVDNLAGATLAMFDADTAMELFSPDGDYLIVSVGAAEGVDAEELRDTIAAVLGEDYLIQTGQEAAADAAAAIGDALGFFTTGMLVFAAVALFVGAFIIANTFSIIIAQRTRELALLRAVGASRRQVLGAVLAEALIVGSVGSLVGVALAGGLAVGLRALLDAVGFSLPSGDLVFNVSAVVTGLALGIVVTTVSALAPAIRATRIPPVAALTAAAAPPLPRAGRGRVVAGVLVTGLGLGALALGLYGDGGLVAVGAGAAILLIGLALLAVLVAKPVLVVVGWPIARGLAIRGELARENALRNPRRTAATASALMIGLGLVSFASIFGASLTRSAETMIDESFRAEYVVRGAVAGLGGLSEELAPRLEDLDEVAVVSPVRFTEFQIDEVTRFGLGVDPRTIERVLGFGDVQGAVAAVEGGGLALRRDAAESAGLALGDEVAVALPRVASVELPVRAIFDAQIDVAWLLDQDTVMAGNREARVQMVYVSLAEGVDAAHARPALESVVDDYPAGTLLSQADQKEEIAEQVNQLLALMTGLLILSVLIALFGIVNTLSLSVFERTAELGLLRAIGMSRRQVRAMVRWESVLISVLGALLGLGVGVLFGWLVVRALADEGISQLALPGGQLVLGLVVAAAAGVLAAAFPARRAARVDVLRAISTD